MENTNNTLQQKYRPKNLDDLYGNEGVIDMMFSFLDRPIEKMPKVFLFTGKPGTGKTTMAYVLKEELQCSNFFEFNASNERKLEDVRKIIQESKYPALDGGIKIYFFDECFAAGTQIRLADGTTKNIEKIVKGDKVQNLKGTGEVTCTFKNRVPLNRVVKVKTGDYEVICSCDHEFLTNVGWKKAKELTSQDKVIIPKRTENEKTVYELQKRFTKETGEILQQGMCLRTQKNTISGGESVLYMQHNFLSEILSPEEDMFTKLWEQISCSEKNRKEKKQRSLFENVKGTQKFQGTQQTTFQRDMQRKFREDEKAQSYAQRRNCSENERNKRTKRNFACMARNKRGQWEINKTSRNLSRRNRIIDGIRNTYRAFSTRWFWIPLELQSRFSRTFSEVSCRSRWQGTSFEREATIRQEKRKEISFTRVDSVEVYKQGSNDKSFKSVISSKERNQGFVYFYDFEVSGHHSYVANHMLVHNCHQLTPAAFEALNKPLEFTEKNTFFILATSEPDKVPAAIKTRATHLHFNSLQPSEILKLLNDVCKKEKIKIDKKHLKTISEKCEGSSRLALKTLDTIMNLEEESSVTEILSLISVEDNANIKELCQALLKAQGDSGWNIVKNIVKNLKEEPESVRRAVLGYMNAVLLNNGGARAALIIECFENNYFDSGKAGLSLSCFKACFLD